MTTLHSKSSGNVLSGPGSRPEPCLQIQVDLSAMLDGELDAPSVRRVMVHSDVCPACRSFLRGIRHQLRAHRVWHELGHDGEPRADGVLTADRMGSSSRVRALRRQLMKNREQLSRILYEMGRGFVLMGVSPNFTREVASEPVPIPDLYMSGCSLVDEVERLTAGKVGEEWVRAKFLFGRGEMRSATENLQKGKRLLREALILEPGFHEARIYLGHAHHVEDEKDMACRQFRRVLEASRDLLIRAFALENLGNVFLEDGRPRASIAYFLELVDSGVIAKEPRFFTSYFNLALAYGLLGELEECHGWLSRLHREFPHKRRLVGQEIGSRVHLYDVLQRHPATLRRFAVEFPEWFAAGERSC